MKSTDKYVLVLVASLALFLAGCGGGSSTTTTPPPDPGPTAGETAIMNAKQALSTAQAAVGSATTDQGRLAAQQGVVQAASTLIDVLTANGGSAADIRAASNALGDARNAIATLTSAIDEANMAMMIMARKLYMGIEMNDINGGPEVAPVGSNLNVVSGGTTIATVKPSGTMLAALHGWEGTDYVDSTGGVTNRVVLYSNRGATTQPFLEKWGPAAAVTANQIADATGRIAQTALTAQASNVGGSDFATVGTTAHTKNQGDQVSVSGTFDGASGTYSCQQTGTTACSSAKAANGITLAGGWYFTPAPGAMTSTPDASWLAYGWWSRETANGVEVSTINQIMVAGGTQQLSSLTIEGTATYRGGAAGKYAIYDPLGGSVAAGAFTADAMLTANFSATAANANVSGEITGFMSGGEAMDWTVTLLESPVRSNPVGLVDNDAVSTEWTIGGTAAAESGRWNARFLEADATTGVPQTAYGQFISTYGNTGQVTGAFGVDLED